MANGKRGMGVGAAFALRRPVANSGDEHSLVSALVTAPGQTPLQGLLLVRVDQIAPHPDNPRDNLGELEELSASIRSLGLRQPIVVVPREAFQIANPGVVLPPTAQWVVIAGHRRRAAAELADVEEVPAWVRPDLASRADAAETFLVENIHRAGLSPLEEARAFALLADLGGSQREIAQRSGVSQAHVSKRLALLRLPQPVQDALVSEQLTVGDALALAAAPADQQLEIFQIAQERHWPVPSAIREVERLRQSAHSREEARSRAKLEGLTFLEDVPRELPGAVQLFDAVEVGAARRAGELFASADADGQFVYVAATGAPVAHGGRRRKEAAAARAAAAGRLVRRKPSAKVAAEAVVNAVLFNEVPHGDALKLVHSWLGDSVGITDRNAARWRDSVRAEDASTRAWVAWAFTVAAKELLARREDVWDPSVVQYVQLLSRDAAYEPTAWETEQMSGWQRGGTSGDSDGITPVSADEGKV